ncbi:hypothetical protein GO755_31385 [Spirosoma sp. HMF4905]|uniref:Uncharacterized protein n=1 Tax=Spirosoma arboris TaxID=2682092 RepID=A0A7K1SLC1_9BACT|nr:hypothetical protein [Spirosoma arboris]MVM34574.1 hypothetical protein [Spirosoma arboris]
MITVITVIAAHHVMVLAHEWSHSMVGWLLGYKAQPFDIIYGDWTLFHAEEAINYEPIFRSSPWKASLIAVAALVTNVFLYLLSQVGLRKAATQRRPLLTQALFWFAVFNLAELYSYMPLRAFSPNGDVGHFETGLSIPAWIGFVLGTPLVAWQLFILLTKSLPIAYNSLEIRSTVAKIAYSFLTASIVFGLYGSAPIFYYSLAAPQARWSIFSAIVWAFVLFLLTRSILKKQSIASIH